MADLGELIESFCEEHIGECCFFVNHNTRFIFGRLCVGIHCRKNCRRLLIQLCDYLYERGYPSSSDVLGNICQDSLGRDTVIYFPSIEYKDEGVTR